MRGFRYGIDNDNLYCMANARGFSLSLLSQSPVVPALGYCLLAPTVIVVRVRCVQLTVSALNPRILYRAVWCTSIYEMMTIKRQHTMMKVLEQICVVASAPSVSLKMPSSGHQFFLLLCIAFVFKCTTKRKWGRARSDDSGKWILSGQ